ncbi:MAG: glutamate/aspartate ABC transporter substrate-binding protein [Rhodocyclales bacterium]|nr:glutamate/aspartate ABC transporter substrate-binding protein [Rhodocyclales bacterium]
MKRLLLLAAIGLNLLSLPAAAAPDSPTLKRIREQGVINLGHRESSIPFSYYDDKQQVIGYSQDFMSEIVRAIKGELGLPALQVRLMPVTSANRISLMLNGTIDLECGSTTNTVERQRQVGFSNHLFLYGIRLMVRKDAGVGGLDDLKGRNVVTTAGTTAERLLRQLNEERKPGFSLISAKDHGESFLTLETGRAAAFVMDEPLLHGEKAKARKADDWAVVGRPLQTENYACMLPKGDEGFKKVVDGAIARLMTSGEAEKIYNKWFMSPIPPKGINLGYPMSEEIRSLYKRPNDQL